jgi:hypothetical protein
VTLTTIPRKKTKRQFLHLEFLDYKFVQSFPFRVVLKHKFEFSLSTVFTHMLGFLGIIVTVLQSNVFNCKSDWALEDFGLSEPCCWGSRFVRRHTLLAGNVANASGLLGP